MKNKRIITFDLPDYKGKKYRAFCHFGYHHFISCSWWVEIQVETYRKKYILFGPKVSKWDEIYQCWLFHGPDTMDELKTKCEKIYDEHVLLPNRIIEKAMNL